jgi:Na+/citrate or Na+/malate symporter
LLIFQAKTEWEGNFEIVKRNEEKEAEEEEDEKRNESKNDGKCVKRKSVHMVFMSLY